MKKFLSAATFIAASVALPLAQAEVYKPGNGITAPVAVHLVQPRYTKNALDRKVQGRVELECVVQSDGTADRIKVTQSLDEELDQQAVIALKQWTFRPGTKEGKAVPVQVNVEMTFTLK